MDSTTVGDSSFIVRNGEVTILQSDHESSDYDDDSSDDISNASMLVVRIFSDQFLCSSVCDYATLVFSCHLLLNLEYVFICKTLWLEYV